MRTEEKTARVKDYRGQGEPATRQAKASWTLRAAGQGELASRLIALARDLDETKAQGWLIARRPGRAVFRLPELFADNIAVIAKVHWPRSTAERVKYGVKPTRARREWTSAERLRTLGIPAPEMFALGEFRRRGLWTRSVLFARAVQPGTALNDYLLAGAPAAEIRRLAKRLAGLLARLHDAGIHARDLHGWNILLDAKDGRLDLCFVDLDELRVRRTPALRYCADDLARLGVLAPVGRFTKLRLLVNYLRARGIPRAQWRVWHGAVLQRAKRMALGLRNKYGREPEDFIRWFSERRNVLVGQRRGARRPIVEAPASTP